MKLFKKETKDAAKEKRYPKKALTVVPKGYPLLLGPLDEMVQSFSMATRNRGSLVSRTIAIAVKKALIANNP